jgi:5-hydroxyisourate hydrolase
VAGLSTHVLDAVTGSPAQGVRVGLRSYGGDSLAEARTDLDGRITDFGVGTLAPGRYRLVFDTEEYFASAAHVGETFYPEVVITFEVRESRHHHVPLLLSPFAYSTYRGS